MNLIYLHKEAKAWVRRTGEPDEVIQIVPGTSSAAGMSYDLYTAFEKTPDYLGRILFDSNGYWIYDGEAISVDEQEQLAKFIINYVDTL